ADLERLANGVRVHRGDQTLEITTLRDDVIRVRSWQGSREPENSSWAVLPDALHSSARVTPEPYGFSTGKLHIALGKGIMFTVTDNSGGILEQDTEPIVRHGTNFRVYKRRSEDNHFFGLGDKPGPLDRSGEAFTLWNTDTFGWQESTDPIYKSIPFFIDFRAGRALGVLFDNTWRTWFDFGKEDPKQYSFSAPNGPVDYYLLYGPTPKQVVEAYAWLTGPPPLPPLWSLGFQQSRYSYASESEVRAIADRLRADHIPADAIYLDIDFQQNNRPFTVDSVKFPHFSSMIEDLAQQNFH